MQKVGSSWAKQLGWHQTAVYNKSISSVDKNRGRLNEKYRNIWFQRNGLFKCQLMIIC